MREDFGLLLRRQINTYVYSMSGELHVLRNGPFRVYYDIDYINNPLIDLNNANATFIVDNNTLFSSPIVKIPYVPIFSYNDRPVDLYGAIIAQGGNIVVFFEPNVVIPEITQITEEEITDFINDYDDDDDDDEDDDDDDDMMVQNQQNPPPPELPGNVIDLTGF